MTTSIIHLSKTAVKLELDSNGINYGIQRDVLGCEYLVVELHKNQLTYFSFTNKYIDFLYTLSCNTDKFNYCKKKGEKKIYKLVDLISEAI